ncbi:YheC/YheD family protein [Salipaludibacillus keqinensis]|nr:YheC/YheD family protein [Salipaludibacillus keqinensis]
MINVKWITMNDHTDICFPESFKKTYSMTRKRVKFKFGTWIRTLNVTYKKDLPVDVIALSDRLQDDLFIPEDLLFEMKLTKNTMQIGPMILWIAAATHERLDQRLVNLEKRINNFVKVRGMICVCAEEGINIENKKIEGYYYRPDDELEGSKWVKAVFHYPGGIFKRVPLSKKVNDHLNETTKGKMFNSYFFNKWEMWKWLSKDKNLVKHLPYTEKLMNVDQISRMLEAYPSVYIKPSKGSEGKRIMKLEKQNHPFNILKRTKPVISIKDDTNNEENLQHIENHPLVQKSLNSSRQYLIQQGVPTKYKSSQVDFRIYMLKNSNFKWESMGITARVSEKNSIITNLRRLAYWQNGREALKSIYGLKEEEAVILERKVVKICKRACRIADEKGNYGDFAIDFVIDKDLHMWILEMNLRQVYPVEDPAFEPKVKSTPFSYAMSLDGFPENLSVN